MQNRIRNRLPNARVRFPAVFERIAPDGHAERPGPDGIRHQLVARIKAEIAAGTYMTDEKWLEAETKLIQACGGE